MFSIFQLDFSPNHISYLFPPVQLHVPDLPLPFGQFSTSLRANFHFPSPNLPLPFSAIFQQNFSPNYISYLFPRPTACAQFATFFRLIFLSLATLFLLNWLNFTFNFFQTVQRIFTNYFQVLQYPGAQTTACKAQHSQGCNVFYKIVNCHLCWKAFSPRHLHFGPKFGGCCTLESW